MRNIFGSAQVLVTALLALLAGCPDQLAETPKPAPAPRAAQVVLADALQAHGGRAALADVQALHVRSVLERGAARWETEVIFAQPDRFLQCVDTGDVRLRHGHDGAQWWAALDQTPVPLSTEERDQLQEQLLFVRPDLLLILNERELASAEIADSPSGQECITVRMRKGRGGPWRLGFDAATHLLCSIALGKDRDGQEASMLLDDYRVLNGVLTPWRARWMHGSTETAVNTVTQMEHAAPGDTQSFAAPQPVPAAELAGCTPGMPTLRVATSEWSAGCAALNAHMQRHGIQRSGPIAAEYRDGLLTAVSVAISSMPPPFCGPLPEDAVHAEARPPQQHLRSVLSAESPEDAMKQLRGLPTAASRPCVRLLEWGPGHWVVQFPAE